MRVAEKFVSINGEGPFAGELAVFLRFAGCNLRCGYCDTMWANQPDCPVVEETPEQLTEYVKGTGVANVTVTGGEPLLQNREELLELFERLMRIGNPDLELPPSAECEAKEALADNRREGDSCAGDFCIESESGGNLNSGRWNCHREADAAGSVRVEIETNGAVDLAPFCGIFRPVFTMDYKLPGSGCEGQMCLSNLELLERQDTVKFVCGSRRDLERAESVIREYRLAGKCHVYLSPVFGSIEPREMVEYMEEHRLNQVRLQLQLHKFIWDPDRRGV